MSSKFKFGISFTLNFTLKTLFLFQILFYLFHFNSGSFLDLEEDTFIFDGTESSNYEPPEYGLHHLYPDDLLLEPQIVYSKEVNEAMNLNKPIVALESTVISHGLPFPENFETAKELENIVRSNGAVPATIAIINGTVKIGLSEEDLRQLAVHGSQAIKVSRRDIAFTVALKKTGATTVSATSFLASKVGIKVFVTGGIGGVHRGGEVTMDISADLTELGRTPIAVVCAGAKSILDIGRTLEFLETQGVPVLGYQTDEFPKFFTSKSGYPVSARVNSPEECAQIIATNYKLNLNSGILIAVPIPENEALRGESIEKAIEEAIKETDGKNMGKELTPYLLKRVNELTKGESLKANIALLKNNAKIGSMIANALKFEPKSVHPNSIDNETPKAVVIGGSVIDLIAKSYEPLIPHTKNPGYVSQHLGGVGRNIAEALTRLNQKPLFLSAVGSDWYAKMVEIHSNEIGLNTDSILVSHKYKTAVYSATLNNTGEMVFAISDMDIFQELTPSYIDKHADAIRQAHIVLVDANAPIESLERVVQLSKNVWFEPTSVPKSKKASLYFLNRVAVVTPNEEELTAMLDVLSLSSADSSKWWKPNHKDHLSHEDLIRLFMSKTQVKYVILKRGKLDVILAYRSAEDFLTIYFKYFPVIPVTKIINVTGAGDSFVGGVLWGVLKGNNIQDSIQFGIVAAKLSIESDFAINPSLSENLLFNI